MKLKSKGKGKVYPSPSPPPSSPLPPSSSTSSGEDYLSVLKLLPAAVLTLASVLSVEDREVLAYMITRSLKITTTAASNPSLISQDYHPSKKPPSKKPPPTSKLTQKSGVPSHKPPVFHCDCFDCYTSYWLRWDSSPNLELIHQIIEAFEDYLTNGESQKLPKKNARAKQRKCNRRIAIPISGSSVQPDDEAPGLESSTVEPPVFSNDAISMEEEEVVELEEVTEDFPAIKDADVQVRTAATSNHKGLARKVLPDVLGLFNSRLWRLWNPNV